MEGLLSSMHMLPVENSDGHPASNQYFCSRNIKILSNAYLHQVTHSSFVKISLLCHHALTIGDGDFNYKIINLEVHPNPIREKTENHLSLKKILFQK